MQHQLSLRTIAFTIFFAFAVRGVVPDTRHTTLAQGFIVDGQAVINVSTSRRGPVGKRWTVQTSSGRYFAKLLKDWTVNGTWAPLPLLSSSFNCSWWKWAPVFQSKVYGAFPYQIVAEIVTAAVARVLGYEDTVPRSRLVSLAPADFAHWFAPHLCTSEVRLLAHLSSQARQLNATAEHSLSAWIWLQEIVPNVIQVAGGPCQDPLTRSMAMLGPSFFRSRLVDFVAGVGDRQGNCFAIKAGAGPALDNVNVRQSSISLTELVSNIKNFSFISLDNDCDQRNDDEQLNRRMRPGEACVVPWALRERLLQLRPENFKAALHEFLEREGMPSALHAQAAGFASRAIGPRFAQLYWDVQRCNDIRRREDAKGGLEA